MRTTGSRETEKKTRQETIRSSKLRTIFMKTKTVALCVLTLLLFFGPLVEAQQPAKTRRIVVTRPEKPGSPIGLVLVEAFRQGLRELGYVDGKNITVEVLWLGADPGRTPERIVELVRQKVDLIVTSGTGSTRAAQQATTTIPVVMANSDDPVVNGFVASFARPGANITGLTSIQTELSGKRLELLKEAVRKAARVAVLWNGANAARARAFKETQVAAGALGVVLQSLEVQAANDFEKAFRAASKERAQALVVFADGLLNGHRTQIVELAGKNRLPAMYTEQEYVDAGGLMVYASSQPWQYRRAATYVDKIFKGARPADLPVELPMKFELVINLKAAKQIGLTVPPNLLVRADRVIR
jgi:putative ABC transport system substrate-binding protein